MSARKTNGPGLEHKPHGRSAEAPASGWRPVHSSVNGHAQSVVFVVSGNHGPPARTR
jgi:hypothetical protein